MLRTDDEHGFTEGAEGTGEEMTVKGKAQLIAQSLFTCGGTGERATRLLLVKEDYNGKRLAEFGGWSEDAMAVWIENQLLKWEQEKK